VGLFHGMGFKGEVGKNSLCAGTRRSQPEVFPCPVNFLDFISSS
jgi:hypothetical protein